MGGAKSREFNLMADMGLLPDGTPMEIPAEILSSMRVSARSLETRAEVITEEYVELPLDNFAKNGDYSYHGTFNNRFWVAESAYKPGGPVFIYDVGEANAAGNALFRLQNETSFFKQLVDKYNGIGIVWEHRYCKSNHNTHQTLRCRNNQLTSISDGNSTPEPITLDTPPEVFKFLTTEQSLADVDRFAKQFKRKNINATLTPNKTPWVFVGGSYPAMRAAFMREKYPETIFASYASSAPTEAQVDMSVYFEPVWRGMNAYGFGNCTKDIHAAINYIDKKLENKKDAAALKEQFLGLGAAGNSNPTFADALSVIFYMWQSYGVDGGSTGLRYFCDYIETDPATNKTAGASGQAAVKGPKWTVDRWASWKPMVALVNNYMTTDCSGNKTVKGDCNLDLRFTDPASIAWTWQYCTQWGKHNLLPALTASFLFSKYLCDDGETCTDFDAGYLQSANLGEHQLVSKYNSLTHQKDICHRQFPTAKAPLFPEWPQTDKTNKVFGGWDIRPSQVYWSGGEFDPWRTLSPLSQEPFPFTHPKPFTSPPKCGQGQSKKEIFGYVIPGAQHCYDFRTYFVGGEISRKYFTDALSSWLTCFKPKNGKPWKA
jgi:hypothetical protein